MRHAGGTNVTSTLRLAQSSEPHSTPLNGLVVSLMSKMSFSPSNAYRRVKRDLTIRSGLVVACSSLLALLLLTIVYWFFLVHNLETRIESSLEDRHHAAENNTVRFTNEERKLFQQFRLSLPIRDEGVFSWLDESREQISGSVSGAECKDGFYDGWLEVSRSAADGPIPLKTKAQADKKLHDRFRFLANQREERCLVFGRSMYEVDELRGSLGGAFFWLVPLCLIPSILISLFYSMSIRKRLKQFGNVVGRVAGGELSARIEIAGDDDLDRLGRTTNRSFDRLQESVNTLQQVSSVIAHDLRGPLNRASNPLDEAIRQNEAGKVAVDPLYKVQEGLHDARTVFDALLRITQIESGRKRTEFKQIQLSKVCEELFEIYEAVVEDSGRTFEVDTSGGGNDTIEGDIDLLRQAVVNLVENAIRYTPEGANIKIHLLRHAVSPELSVIDNGPGVPETERERVVQRLYRFEGSTRGQHGHGLGLSLVKAIAELHHGNLVLEDAQPGLKVCIKFQSERI